MHLGIVWKSPLPVLLPQPIQSLAQGRLVAPPRMEEAMRQTYNISQMNAVTAGLGGSQVVLIQGPPGALNIMAGQPLWEAEKGLWR